MTILPPGRFGRTEPVWPHRIHQTRRPLSIARYLSPSLCTAAAPTPSARPERRPAVERQPGVACWRPGASSRRLPARGGAVERRRLGKRPAARDEPGESAAERPAATRIMAHRGHLDGRSAQAPGLMRHGAFSAANLSGHQPFEPSPAATLEFLENKLAGLTAEAEKLIRENQRLASSHVVLRQDIVDTEKEMQMIRAHLGDVQVETDMHMRDLMERIRLMEADIEAGDAVKKELHQVHMEAKRLITERQMLTSEIEIVTKELQKFSGDNNNLPELLAELDGLRKEHHSLRSAFEYQKNTNIKQVEQMRTMEINLITMTKEADKLRADVANAGNRAHAAQVTAPQPGTAQAAGASAATNPYASAYTNHPSAYQQGTPQAVAYQQATPQAGAYQQGIPQAGAYQQGTPAGTYAYPAAYDTANAYQLHAAHASAYAGYSGYPVAGYAQPSYPGTYAAPQHPITSSAATDVASMYGAVSSAGYPAGLVQPSSGAANTGQAPPAPYPATYDPTRRAQT